MMIFRAGSLRIVKDRVDVLILSSSQGCRNGCAGCYLAWRSHDTQYNLGYLEEAVVSGIADKYVIEVCNDAASAWGARSLVCLCKNHKRHFSVAVNAADWKLVDRFFLEGCSLLSLSLTGHLAGDNPLVWMARRMGVPMALLIRHDEIRDLEDAATAVETMRTGKLHLVMSKGDPSTGWRILPLFREYAAEYMKLRAYTGLSVWEDYCWLSSYDDVPSPCSQWLELNAYGEVRTCPYSSLPSDVLKSVSDVGNLPSLCGGINFCRRGDDR